MTSNQTSTSTTLTAIQLGEEWAVQDSNGGTWHPNDAAMEEIVLTDDPGAAAVEMCDKYPRCGEWHS